jgi:hypothetical protein
MEKSKNNRSSIFVPPQLARIIKSRAALRGLYQYQYISRLVLDEMELPLIVAKKDEDQGIANAATLKAD